MKHLKRKTLIIIFIISAILITSLIVSVLIYRHYAKGNKSDEQTKTGTSDGISLSGITRPKSTRPDEMVTVYVDSSVDLTENIDNIKNFGFNSVTAELTDNNSESVSEATDFLKKSDFYFGIHYTGSDFDYLYDFVTDNNIDYVILNQNADVSVLLENYVKLKNIDNSLSIGLCVNNTSAVNSDVYDLVSGGCFDFVSVNQNSDDIDTFSDSMALWDEIPCNVNFTFYLNSCKSEEECSSFISMISEADQISQCDSVTICDYNLFLSNTFTEINKYIKNKQNYFRDKELEIYNYNDTDIMVSSSEITFTGTCSPEFELKCNDNTIIVADNGDFSYDVKLNPGLNKVIFSHKGKTIEYNVTFELNLIQSVTPDKSITVPGGIKLEISASAYKDASVSVSFNGKNYQMSQNGVSDEDEETDNGNTDYAYFTASINIPSSESSKQQLGSFTVTATYNNSEKSVTGGSITVNATRYSGISNNEHVVTTTSYTAASEIPETSSSASAGKTTKSFSQKTTKPLKRTTTGKNSGNSTESDAETTSGSNSQQFSYGLNYGLGICSYCVMTADYVETYSGTSTSTKSSPEYSPLLNGTADVITGVGEDSDGITYYYLKSGMKVPEYIIENTNSGPKSKVKQVKVVDGYVMPRNSLKLLSCTNSGNETIIKIETNRLVPFNARLTGQTYSSYKGRNVAVSKPDFSGLKFTFYDTSVISGSISLSGSLISKYSVSSDENTSVLNLSVSDASEFCGFHYEYSDGILTIVIKSKPNSLSNCTIILDAGHGGYDSGASCVVNSSNWSEKRINLSLAVKIKSYLESEGATVIMTRSSDSMYSLTYRNSMARTYMPDMFIAIHCDSSSSSAYGTSAYYYRAYSQPLAKAIHNSLVNCYRNKIYGEDLNGIDRGTNFYAFKVCRVEECPSVLIEYGFVSNTEECQLLENASTRDLLAKATVNGIKNYLAN